MAAMLGRFKVQDYDKWRQVFESKAELRKGAGCTGTHIFINADDKNDITVNFQWDTADNAKAFFSSDAARQAIQDAGVIGMPDVWIVEDGGRTAN